LIALLVAVLRSRRPRLSWRWCRDSSARKPRTLVCRRPTIFVKIR